MYVKSIRKRGFQLELKSLLVRFREIIRLFEDSDHMLVVIILRARIYRPNNTQQLRRFAVERLKDRDVASRYYDEVESELQGVQAQPLSLDEKCKKLEETIQRVAKNTIGYTKKQENEVV
jgi:hypothetical protein